ncbi:DNA repair protein rhp54 [Sphaceloma murrayae]|uniref:DNA repair protein rhp54 n=1 Tax=Sphaceloma murrayae TaxID=2082308 RepID=A0A2K1R089_9PEZI|nr:DNA repair protein rhp54 [Sphaceloma murrayae]
MILADLLERALALGVDTSEMVTEGEISACLRALGQSGRSSEARDIVFAKSLQTVHDEDGTDSSSGSPTTLPLPDFDFNKAIYTVTYGFASDNAESEILRTIEMCSQVGKPFEESSTLTALVCYYYLHAKNAGNAKKWYGMHQQARSNLQAGETDYVKSLSGFQLFKKLFDFCIDTDDRAWGHQLAADVLNVLDPQRSKRLLLLWAAGTGKGCEEIDRMIGLMQQSHGFHFDVQTVNLLIEFALKQKNAYMAEKFFNLGIAKGVQLNARTYIMQVEYRCSVNDVDGALRAYDTMRKETFPKEGEETKAVNRLVRAMCGTRVHDFESIMNVAADLTDAGAPFDAETVSTLAILHLSRGELDDTEDLLNTHAFQYSVAQRQGVLQSLIDFCLDPVNSSELVWGTYQLVQKTFDDMNRDQRTKLMQEMMRRGLGHLAVQIFEHMRLHTREDTLPLMETYIECLHGITRLNDRDSFNALYNLLKLDTSIEPNTALHNALMQACIACGEASQALSFWNRIIASSEGPDMVSINLVLLACQDAPSGDELAVEIHSRLEVSGFEMHPGYYAWLLAAIGAHGRTGETINVMERLYAVKGLAPTMDMIGSLLNVTGSPEAQQVILEWAKQRVPVVHSQLERNSLGEDVLGRRKFRGVSRKGDVHILA